MAQEKMGQAERVELAGYIDEVLELAKKKGVGHGAGLLAHLRALRDAVLEGDQAKIAYAFALVVKCIFGEEAPSGIPPMGAFPWTGFLSLLLEFLRLWLSN